jgi:large subunit ribosomal protein L29
MSLAKAKDFRNLSIAELEQKKAAHEKELHDLRQKKAAGTLDKPHFFKRLRREIAQINTVKRENQNG